MSEGRHTPADLLALGLDPTPGARWVPPAPAELAPHLPGFQLERMLGRGGMGAVYLARQVALERLVAIKLLPVELGRDALFAERFRREAVALARLSHPHIVSIFDLGQTAAGHLYFVMEYVEGHSLHELIQGPAALLPPVEALGIVEQVCDALTYAHSQGIVHRDIKPANILLGRDGRAKVADFGLAQLLEPKPEPGGLTLTGALLGTPDYMAPEQKRGQPVDHRADIYALGIVLYEALCGETPLGAFQMPSRRRGLPKGLDAIITRAIAPEPGQRFPSAEEMKAAVVAIRPLVARAQAAAERVRPGKKRWPPLLAGVAALLAALLALALPLWKPRPPAPARSAAVLVNSLGMRFVPVPIAGGPTGGRRILFSVWETRRQDYAPFARERALDWDRVQPGFPQGPTQPALMVSWVAAGEFAAWLTEREREAGTLGPRQRYRLPSDHEWSCAAGLGGKEDPALAPQQKNGVVAASYFASTSWPPPPRSGNFASVELLEVMPPEKTAGLDLVQAGYRDGFAYTAPVGSFAPNAFGLYDVGGNVQEWCEDWVSSSHQHRVLRDSHWFSSGREIFNPSSRSMRKPRDYSEWIGFRLVLAEE